MLFPAMYTPGPLRMDAAGKTGRLIGRFWKLAQIKLHAKPEQQLCRCSIRGWRHNGRRNSRLHAAQRWLRLCKGRLALGLVQPQVPACSFSHFTTAAMSPVASGPPMTAYACSTKRKTSPTPRFPVTCKQWLLFRFGADSRYDPTALADGQNLIGLHLREPFHLLRGRPLHFDEIHRLSFSQAEVQAQVA